MEYRIINICVLCLCTNQELRAVRGSSCERIFFMLFEDVLSDMDSECGCVSVCWQCVALLSSFTCFKRRAERSINTLFTYLHSKNPLEPVNFESISSKPRLNKSHVSTDSYKEKEEQIESNTNIENDDRNSIIETNSDSDSDVPLQQIKIKKKCKKVKKDRLKTAKRERLRKKSSLDSNKIKMILLTQEQLMEERQTDLLSPAYLKLPYKCETCIQGFDHEQTLKDHMDRKHNLTRGKYECDTCKSVLSTLASFGTHKRRHLLRFECVACGKRTIDKGAILKHYSSEHEDMSLSYMCSDCGEVLKSYRALRYHKEKHKEKPQCADCGATFINSNSLRCHSLSQHGGERRRFACPDCGKTYRGKSGLLMHSWAHRAPPAYCAPCDTHFSSPHNYKHHMKTHRNHRSKVELKHACNDCDEKFPTEKKLTEHREFLHLNSSKHQCAVCGKRFKQKVGLQRHCRFVHEKIRPPRDKMCHHCGKEFTSLSVLMSHIDSHTHARPASFTRRAALYTHTERHRAARSEHEEQLTNRAPKPDAPS